MTEFKIKKAPGWEPKIRNQFIYLISEATKAKSLCGSGEVLA